MSDEVRYFLFWPVALALWKVSEGLEWIGDRFEDWATVDYKFKRARKRAATKGGQS